MGLEKSSNNTVKKKLNLLSECKAIRVPQNGWGEKGTPDIIGSYRGRMFALEGKQPGKKPTKIQEERLKEWSEAGAITGVFNCFDDVIDIFMSVGININK